MLTGLHQIQDLRVKCDNVVKGCTWIGKLQDIGNHLAFECLQAYVICPKECYNNGLVPVLRKNLKRHLTLKCPKRNEPDIVRLVLNLPNNSSNIHRHSEPTIPKEQLSSSTTSTEIHSIMAVGESDQKTSDMVCALLVSFVFNYYLTETVLTVLFT